MNSPDIATQQSIQFAMRPQALVIGSGFGGLAAAIRLGERGYRVTILEKLEQAGGRARVHRQDGFVFDAGPTIITAPHLFEELWSLCGKRFSEDVDLKLMTPFYRIRFNDGSHFDYSGDPDKTRAEIARFSPGDVAGYDRFMKASAANYRVGFEELVDRPFSRLWDMIKVLPDMLRLRAYRSVHTLVAQYIKDPRIRMVLSFHPLLIGGNPYSASSVYTLISHLERQGGVYSAMGGTGHIIDAMAKLFESRGGEIRYHTEVSKIRVREGRADGVELADGQVLSADVVVSNADAAWTYKYLLQDTPRRTWTDKKLARARYSNGLFVWYFGTDCRYDEVPHHSILLGPRYRELLDDIFKHKHLATDFSLYLHRPTATDPGMAPAGCDAFYVLAPVPNLQGSTDWQAEAEPFRRAVERHLGDTILPGLDQHLVTSRVSTPLDFQQDLNAYQGAGFGMEPVLLQSAWFRPHNLSEDIANLYLVGAGTHPGAGVPGVLSSAKVLDTVVPHADALA